MLHSIKITNLLSFGDKGMELSLLPLNVFIGPNGSGKSNLLEVIGAARNSPNDVLGFIEENGGGSQWFWKGAKGERAAFQVEIEQHGTRLRHQVELIENSFGLGLTFGSELVEQRARSDEIQSEQMFPVVSRDDAKVQVWPHLAAGLVFHPSANSLPRTIPGKDIVADRSIIAQLREPLSATSSLERWYSQVRIYKDWSFGRNAPARLPRPADGRGNFLHEDCSNLALFLSGIREDVPTKRKLVAELKRLYPDIEDFDVIIKGGTVQLYLQDSKFSIPATRLSDGTLRYLCLLAILCDPEPPPLVCIEEPELGLHPDVLPGLARLMVDASTRMQLIVTTHSEIIVDALSDHPEYVVVTERHEGSTTMRRLDPDQLTEWLQTYRLGQLWSKGEIGGNRW